MNGTTELAPAEAAVALAALVSFSDDEPSDAEGVVLRKYYRLATAEALQKKLTAAGLLYPSDLTSLEGTIVSTLAAAPKQFQMRSVAVAWMLALADGQAEQEEVAILNRVCDKLGFAPAEARDLAEAGIPEIDETAEDEVAAAEKLPAAHVGTPPVLSPEEAGIAIAAWVGFSDDDPSDAEAGVIREHYGERPVARFLERLEEEGFDYPDALPHLDGAILAAFGKASRTEQLRMLAVAHAVSGADGEVEPDEEAIIRRYCEELGIGMAEVRGFLKTSVT